MSSPTWAPTLVQVAAYVPHRTLVRSDASTLQSEDTYQFTFDATTIPTADQVTQLIADGAAWISGRVGTLLPAFEAMAGVAVALYAAAAVERGWPDGDQALQRANDIEKRMDALLVTLVEANDAAGGAGIEITYPVFSFPCPDPRWDDARYW